MLNKKPIKIFITVMMILLLNVAVFTIINFDLGNTITLEYTVEGDHPDRHQLFYGQDENWSEEASSSLEYTIPNQKQTLKYTIGSDVKLVRFDVGNQVGIIKISDMKLDAFGQRVEVDMQQIAQSTKFKDIAEMSMKDGMLTIKSIGEDPFIITEFDQLGKTALIQKIENISYILKGLICILLDIFIIMLVMRRRTIRSLMKEVYSNRTLIWSLSKNDFKTKYAGSYLGIIWAFIQPIVTVLVYWFVFQVGFRSAPMGDFPFVLWLVAGIVPWFFFSEALMNATGSLMEYSYLVKKVVFKISVLPIVKIISALFVHVFFVAFTIILFGLYGYMAGIFTLQLVYYTLCTFVLVLGLSYATCAIIIFFKDLGQIISIFLQVGMWMTPIMWNHTMIADKYQWILGLNPMYYIVSGYRDSLINEIWFWEKMGYTLYFWAVAIGLFGLGAIIFKKLKSHFADVL